MRIAALITIAVALGACTPADDARAREQARQTVEQAKRDGRKAAHEAEIEAEKANRAVTKGLNDARDKVRGALDDPKDRK